MIEYERGFIIQEGKKEELMRILRERGYAFEPVEKNSENPPYFVGKEGEERIAYMGPEGEEITVNTERQSGKDLSSLLERLEL